MANFNFTNSVNFTTHLTLTLEFNFFLSLGDLHSPSALRVQRVVEGKVKEYTVQEDLEQALQRECKVRFSLAHSAPAMKTLLGERLWYLSNESLAGSIIMGTLEKPSDMDPATKLILKNIGKLGIKIVNEEGNEIVITPEEFQSF